MSGSERSHRSLCTSIIDSEEAELTTQEMRNHSSNSSRGKRMIGQLKVDLLLITALSLGSAVWGQTNPQIASRQARIDQIQQSIRNGEQHQLSPAQQGVMWVRLALEYQSIASFSKAEEAYNTSLRLLKTTPSARADYAAALDDLSTLYMSYGRMDDAESAIKQALAERKKLGKLSDIGLSQIHLADIALVRRQFKKAEQLAQRGIQGMQTASNPAPAGLLSGFMSLTYARCSMGRCQEGITSAKQAVAFAAKAFEPESPATGFALETLGFAQWKSGAPQDGEKSMLQGMQILRAKLAPDDPRLAGSMLQYRTYLLEANRQTEAQDIQQQVRSMTRQAGIACSGCAISVNSLSNGLR
jgi:tetratricopeptide (TPR) repeat protein